ncbi:MAG: membrane protein insertase YidC [Deltaproteobacteria bacterium]|nr:membrane protein insertase YidC [Deltaproteobacteria bacterium]
MDNPKRQLAFLAVLGLIAGGLYFADTFAGPSDASPETPAASTEEGAAAAESGEEEEAAEEAEPSVDEAARAEAEEIFTIDTEQFAARFSTLNTGMVGFRLKSERWTDDQGDPLDMVTTWKEHAYTLQIRPRGITIPDDAVWQGEQVDDRTVRFRLEVDGFLVVRKIEAGQDPYQLWSTVRIVNLGEATRPVAVAHFAYDYVEREKEEGGFIGRPSTSMVTGTCKYGDDDVERLDASTLRETAQERWGTAIDPGIGFGPGVDFVSLTSAYFATALAPDGGRAQRCIVSGTHVGGSTDDDSWMGTLFEAELRGPRVELAGGESTVSRTLAFVGPTDRDALSAAGHGLTEVVDLGWFSFIANGFAELLESIHGVVGNWGLAIILLTILVKIVFFPLTWHSFKAMGKMRKLKPQIDAINEKYGDDREKKGHKVMELYRKEKVNPAAGCLPSLLQMPVWFALYRSLSTNVELYHAPFTLYWTDLSSPDPYYVLPVFVALLMHVQQRLTPTTADSAQMKMMMYFMPLMIGAFMLFLPAGLCLYMVTNSVLTMLQQRAIYAKLDREEEAKNATASTLDDEDDSGDEPDDLQPTEALAGASASARRRSIKRGKKRQRRG